MKRLVYLISTVLILTGMYGGSVAALKSISGDRKEVVYCYDPRDNDHSFFE